MLLIFPSSAYFLVCVWMQAQRFDRFSHWYVCQVENSSIHERKWANYLLCVNLLRAPECRFRDKKRGGNLIAPSLVPVIWAACRSIFSKLDPYCEWFLLPGKPGCSENRWGKQFRNACSLHSLLCGERRQSELLCSHPRAPSPKRQSDKPGRTECSRCRYRKFWLNETLNKGSQRVTKNLLALRINRFDG